MLIKTALHFSTFLPIICQLIASEFFVFISEICSFIPIFAQKIDLWVNERRMVSNKNQSTTQWWICCLLSHCTYNLLQHEYCNLKRKKDPMMKKIEIFRVFILLTVQYFNFPNRMLEKKILYVTIIKKIKNLN